MHEELALRLVGTAPLLMHAARLADPLDPFAVALARLTGKRKKTPTDHQRIAQVEWRGGLWLADGRPCVPAEAIEAATVQAAKSRRAGSQVRAAVTVREPPLLDYGGPADLDELYRDERFVFRTGVRVGTRTTIRTRARFDRWAVNVTFAFSPTLIGADDLRQFVELAGVYSGLGDWRPRFGSFRVESV